MTDSPNNRDTSDYMNIRKHCEIHAKTYNLEYKPHSRFENSSINSFILEGTTALRVYELFIKLCQIKNHLEGQKSAYWNGMACNLHSVRMHLDNIEAKHNALFPAKKVSEKIAEPVAIEPTHKTYKDFVSYLEKFTKNTRESILSKCIRMQNSNGYLFVLTGEMETKIISSFFKDTLKYCDVHTKDDQIEIEVEF